MHINLRMKSLAAAALVVSLAAGLTSVAAAQTTASNITVIVDGSPVPLDQPAVVANGRILVPLRGVFLRLGAIVTWDPGSQTVLAQRGSTSVSLTIGSLQAFVNGQPQALDAPAMIVGGHTMVPLRFISQAFGAGVRWDAASSTVAIASQGAPAPPATYVPVPPPPPAVQTVTGTVTQVIASEYPGLLSVRTADGTLYTFRVLSGTAITRIDPATGLNEPVPLSAIGPGDAVTVTADETWTAQMVQALNYPSAPPQQQVPPQPAAETVTGTVWLVNASAYPGQLGVQMFNGAAYTYRIVPGTAISRTNMTTGRGGAVPLGAVQPGDAVTVTVDQEGTAQIVLASFAEITGTIEWARGNRIRLEDGNTYLLAPTAQVAQFGQTVDPAALQPGAAVVLRANPATRQIYSVFLIHGPSVDAITAVTVTPAGRRFDAGDAITVSAAGPAHGTATFSIAGLRAGLPMAESAPGQYIGSYRVQPGDSAPDAGVVVSIAAPNGRVLTATASVTVSIQTRHDAPPHRDAPRPGVAAPVITSPVAGKSVMMPLTVTGTVQPGTRVSVTADYTQSAFGAPAHGMLGSQIVTADAKGTWSATFSRTAPAPAHGANVTIMAVVVDAAGAVRSASTTVSITLQ